MMEPWVITIIGAMGAAILGMAAYIKVLVAKVNSLYDAQIERLEALIAAAPVPPKQPGDPAE